MQERVIRIAGEITFHHSHQQAFLRHITEAHYTFGLSIQVLDRYKFPSGYMYHHEKHYMRRISNHQVFPFAYHMNFNDNRNEKVIRCNTFEYYLLLIRFLILMSMGYGFSLL